MNNKLMLILSLVSTLAFASPGDDGCIGNCDGNSSGGNQTQNQGQLQLQGQGQLQTSTNINNVTVKPTIDASARARAQSWAASQSRSQSSANSVSGDSTGIGVGGNSVSTGGDVSIVNTTIYPNKQRVYSAPAVNVGGVYPTSPCMGSTTVGGSGIGFGVGFGTSWVDDECGIRETARSFSSFGLRDEAVSVLCTSKYAKDVAICNRE